MTHPPDRFPGLDFIRFYASVSVLAYHISVNPPVWFGDPVIAPWLRYFFLHGDAAVFLFFVLSGFLIASMLLRERARDGTISVRRFYRRRALRILPLYGLVLAIGYLVIPAIWPGGPAQPSTEPAAVLLTVFALANVSNGVFGWAHILGHLWSIAIEEQFYLFFPVLFRRFSLPALCGVVIAVSWLPQVIPGVNETTAARLISGSRFDMLALGVLGAWIVHRGGPLLRVMQHRAIEMVVLLLLLAIIVLDYLPALSAISLPVIFMLWIVITATSPRPLFRVNGLRALGNLTYALYMLHHFVIYLFRQTFYGALPDPLYEAVMIIGAGGTSLALAALSYHLIERRMMRWR